MLAQLIASSTWNEYVIKYNFGVVVCMCVSAHVLGSLNIPILNTLLNSSVIRFAELCIVFICAKNIVNHAGSILPSQWISSNYPLRKHMFTSGPLTECACLVLDRILCSARNMLGQGAKQQAPPAPKQPEPTSQQPKSAPAATASALQARPQPWTGPVDDSSAFPEINAAAPLYHPRNFAWMPPARAGDPAFNITLPKLEYTPSHVTRKKKTTRTNKYLWRLCPQPNIIERFRSEQYDDFQENWHQFEDRTSKVYYDRLRQWISSKIFMPAVRTVDAVEQQLPNQDTSFVECPLNILALLITDPSYVNENALSVALVRKLLNLPGYENDRARKYVIERMRELGKQSRFHLIAKDSDLPSDSEIVFHVFKTYLTHAMPNVVPPLLPVQGEILKFLLIYFYITEEISNEIFY